MKIVGLVGALALAASSSSAFAAPIITFTPGGTTPLGTVIEDFSGSPVGTSIGTKAFIYGSSIPNVAATPPAATGPYAGVLSGGTYTLALAPTSLLSFIVGSIDTYNQLILGLANGTKVTYSGPQLAVLADGSQASPLSNGVISVFSNGGPLFTSAIFKSFGNSFEFDTIAVHPAVPEPATWGLMILGFGVVGGALRNRRQASKVSFAF